MTSTIDSSTKNLSLAELASRLLASDYFVGTTDAVLSEKQAIFLAIIGLKPVSEASSGHWEPTAEGRRTVFDDPNQVAALLRSLGLHYKLRHDEHATDALLSRKPELLDAYGQAEASGNMARIGELFGYPKTAVAAFSRYLETGDESLLMQNEAQERAERAAGLADTLLVNFRCSREHWRQELGVCQTWHKTLRAYDLA